MSAHLQREIERLKKHVLSLCALVEDQVQMALRAVLERDETLAAQVEQRDLDIDQREIEVEEECMKVLALHQPVAVDLRLIIATMKINNDLERIGDMAVNIARKARGAGQRAAGRDILRSGGDVGQDASHAPRQHRRLGQYGRGAGHRRFAAATTKSIK